MENAIPVLSPDDWHEYELLDSGQGEKLERFGAYIVSRPDPRAIWNRSAPPSVWKNAHAEFIRSSKDHGQWHIKSLPPKNWSISYKHLVFTLKPSSFKHVGVFPEQAVNWDWIQKIADGKHLRVLNLFGYTGGATLACLAAGAEVVHVDSSKPALDWANENVRASGLGEKPVHWILEDAGKYVAREIRRGHTFDAIIMDPPRFGRGTKGEIWKIEEHLPGLLLSCKSLLSTNPAFVLVNAYTADLSSIALSHLLSDIVKDTGGTQEYGELALRETATGRLLPNGIFVRWALFPDMN